MARSQTGAPVLATMHLVEYTDILLGQRIESGLAGGAAGGIDPDDLYYLIVPVTLIMTLAGKKPSQWLYRQSIYRPAGKRNRRPNHRHQSGQV